MRALAAVVTGALAACGQPSHPRPTGGGDLPYPRIASYHLGVEVDDAARDMLARVPLAILDAELAAVDPDAIAAIRARNPSITLLAYLPEEWLPRDAAPGVHPLADARFDRVPIAAWALAPGSTTVGAVTASDAQIRVAEPAPFLPTTFALVGDEHVAIVGVDLDQLAVTRVVRSAPAVHAPGTPIAPHLEGPPDTWRVDLADPSWQSLVAGDATTALAAGFDGIALGSCPDGGSLDALVGMLPDIEVIADANGASCAHDGLDGVVATATDLDTYLATGRPLVVTASGAETDVAAVRLGVATTLLGDGYFAFDDGGHRTSWWFDEYDGAGRGVGWLGHPAGPPTRVAGGAYVRTFTRGMVIANPTETPLSVVVPPRYRELDDTEVAGSVVVHAHDGALLAH